MKKATKRDTRFLLPAFFDAIERIETLGRCLHPKKRGFIPEQAPKLLERLGIDAAAFIEHGTRSLK